MKFTQFLKFLINHDIDFPVMRITNYMQCNDYEYDSFHVPIVLFSQDLLNNKFKLVMYKKI